jgi:hypothetical protein
VLFAQRCLLRRSISVLSSFSFLCLVLDFGLSVVLQDTIWEPSFKGKGVGYLSLERKNGSYGVLMTGGATVLGTSDGFVIYISDD